MYEEEVLEEIKRFVGAHMEEEITLEKISRAVCYSEEHVCRFFKRRTGENLFDYIRNQRLLRAAGQLREKGGKIVNVAFDYGFNSHEVFTRAFSRYFGISPKKFRQLKPEIKQFMPKGLKAFPLEYRENVMESTVIFTRVIEKDERRLLYYPAKRATHYFDYCEEVGCDVWGRLQEVQKALDEPLGLWLPEKLRAGGCSEYVQGVEVSPGYKGEIPAGLESMLLPAGTFMLFQSQPYEESDENMMRVIQAVQKGMETYNPETYGFEWAKEDAPRYQLMPLGERGYMEALPVRRA